MFTKVLSKLMTETDKPEDAIEFIRANIGDSLNDKDTIVALNEKLEDANRLIEELRTKLRQYEPMEATDSETASVPDTATATPAAAAVAEEPVEPMQVETPKETEASETPAAVVEAAPTAPVITEAATVSPAVTEDKPAEVPTATESGEKTDSPAVVPVAETETPKEESPAAAATSNPVTTDAEKPAAEAATPSDAPKADEKMEN